MEREEKFIIDRFGRKTPFRVPDGYFDDFASQIMQALPEHTHVRTAPNSSLRHISRHYLRPLSMVAACLCFAIFGVTVYLKKSQLPPDGVCAIRIANTVSSTSYTAIDAMADYTMIDTETMYSYMEDID